MGERGRAKTKPPAPHVDQNYHAITAMREQSKFSGLQGLGGNFWDPVSAFALNMAAGNPEEKGLQEQLDSMVEGITAP